MRRAIRGAVVAAAAVALTPAGAHAQQLTDGYGLHVASVESLTPRLLHVQLATQALPTQTRLLVLLPKGYDADAAKRFPVIWLMHGATDSPDGWIDQGQADAVIGDRPVITVIPEVTSDHAGSGWCTNWSNGAQNWETFDIDELRPWIDANFRTDPQRSQRAIVGISEGGFCAMSLAARHPDLFAQAMAYSGVVETWDDLVVRQGAGGVVNLFEGMDGLPPYTVFGDPATHAANWAAHDAGTLAENLRDTRLRIFSGDGTPGPFDSPATYFGSNIAGEVAAGLDAQALQRRLTALKIPAEFDLYGGGTHSWPYWNRDLKQSIDELMANFAAPAPATDRFSYVSGEATFDVYDWTVKLARSAAGLTTLRSLGKDGFDLAGRGTATVTTPPVYEPGRTYAVQVTTAGAGAVERTIAADGRGQLLIDAPLGPEISEEQAQIEAQAYSQAATPSVTTVRISPADAKPVGTAGAAATSGTVATPGSSVTTGAGKPAVVSGLRAAADAQRLTSVLRRGLLVRVRCPTACTVRLAVGFANGSVAARVGRKGRELAVTTKALGANQRLRTRIGLSRASARAVRRAGRRTLRFRAVATLAGGVEVTVARSVKLT